jgi:nitrate reductase gamma subunit
MNGFHALSAVLVSMLAFVYDKLQISGDASSDVAAIGGAIAAVIAVIGIVKKWFQRLAAKKAAVATTPGK